MRQTFNPLLTELVEREAISARMLERILRKAEKTGESVETLLIKTRIGRKRLLEAKAAGFGGLEWIDLSNFVPEPELAGLIPKQMVLRYGLLCIGKKGGKI